MDILSVQLSSTIVKLYNVINRFEEDLIKRYDRINLSVNEMHLLEAIGKRDPAGLKELRTMSCIAEDLGITLPSVTVAVNKLRKKGFVEKTKSPNDGRVFYVTLTRLGEKMDRFHRYFHRKIARYIVKDLSTDEKDVLLKTLTRLNFFFDKPNRSTKED